MAEKKKSKNIFQRIAGWVDELIEWVEETFSDDELGKEVREDLGLNTSNPATPKALDPALKQKIVDFQKEEKVDEIALAQTVAQIASAVDVGMTFAEAVKGDGVTAWDVLWMMFKVGQVDSLRARNPSAYALMSLVGLITEDEETLGQIDPSALTKMLRGEADASDSERFIERFSAIAGTLIVGLDHGVTQVGGRIDALYGWDPEPGSATEASIVAGRTLTVAFNMGDGLTPLLSMVGVPRPHGGPGLLISVGARLQIEHDTGSAIYTVDLGATGAFTLFVPLSEEAQDFRSFGPGTPSFNVKMTPKDPTEPFLVVGTSDSTRLEIGAFGWGIELGADSAGFRATLRKGKLVISLGDGDGFLSKLPGGKIEVPFDLGLIADTKNGIRFDGGTGLKVNLPVAASILGVFNIQYLALELKLSGDPTLEVRGGFAVKLGPFQASIDQIGAVLDFAKIADGADDLDEMVAFAPPRGIGLALDLGVLKGGGFLFVDADKGEYAGALELKVFGVFSIKAIALISTKRPDGSDGWSLILFVFGQFRFHIAFGIFWTGIGGMIGLHHRADLDALTAGLKTGALDDILFPDNPVAEAPRIINRYKQLFPVEADSLLLGPMLELSFSQPPIVYVRLGLIFEVRNALGGDKPATLTKVILLGQMLAQMPPKETGAPAIVKLLIDVVGFYDAQEQFLMIRARLRDSFIGIEGLVKIDLSGEMVLAMRFGDEPSFVLTVGGFHPSFTDVPRGVPTDLERLAVSFGIGPIKLRNETYFAITSNSIQAGFMIELKADIEVASIQGRLQFDALLYLSPRFHFIVAIQFHVSLRAFGTNIASINVRLSLEGPGEWHAVGSFSFSILFWDVEIGFDEKWGSAPSVEAGTTSAAEALRAELADPARLLPGPPVGGNALVTLAPADATDAVLAHPLGVLSLRQKAVPLGVQIDRMGTRKLTEGTPTFNIGDIKVGGELTDAREDVVDHFARGQFMELSEKQKLEGRSFEKFTCGVTVGTAAYVVPTIGTTVAADYEVKILEPETRLNLHWKIVAAFRANLGSDVAEALTPFGAAGMSARAQGALLAVQTGSASVVDPPLAVVAKDTMLEHASVIGLAGSEALAMQTADLSGGLVVEAWEMAL